MKCILFSLIAVSVLFISEQAEAGNKGKIYGYVSDATTGELLPAANIQIEAISEERAKLHVISNSSGYYELELKPGLYLFRYNYLGYETLEEQIEVVNNENNQLNAGLLPADVMMAEFLVESNRILPLEHPAGSMSVPLEYIGNSASTLHSDIFRSIQLLPGVQSSSDFSGGLHIRGGSPDQTLVLLDGTTVYNPTHFYGFYSTFNTDVVDEVTLYKGTFPARYGGRLGSVVEVHNRQGNPEQTSKSVSFGLLSSRALAEGPHPAGSYLVAFRRSTLEPVLSVLRKAEDNIPDHFHFYDLNVSADFKAGSRNLLNLSLYNSLDDLDYPISEVQNFSLNYGNQTGALRWQHMYSDRLFSTANLSVSSYSNNPSFDNSHSLITKENRVMDYSANIYFDWNPSEQNFISAGVCAGHITYGLNEYLDGNEIFSSNIQNYYTTGYIQADQWLSDSWMINAGVRGNWYSEGNYLRFEPRFSLNYNITENSRIQAAAGRYYQFASLITSEAFNGFDIWLSTAGNVPPSYSNQYSLGYRQLFDGNYKFEAETYFRSMHDLFDLNPFRGNPEGLSYEDLFYFEEGFAAGLELFLAKYAGRFSGFAGYTLGTARKRNPEVNNNLYYPPRYDRLHSLNVTGTFELSSNWKVSTVFSYGSGQPYTRPLGWVILYDQLQIAQSNPIITGRINAARLPAYHRLDFGISRRNTLFNRVETELKLEVINVYSRRNVWFYFYGFSDNPPVRSEVTMLPLVPSLTYSFSF